MWDGLIESPVLRAVAQAQGLDEAGPAVGVEGGGLECPADRDVLPVFSSMVSESFPAL